MSLLSLVIIIAKQVCKQNEDSGTKQDLWHKILESLLKLFVLPPGLCVVKALPQLDQCGHLILVGSSLTRFPILYGSGGNLEELRHHHLGPAQLGTEGRSLLRL